MINLKHLLASAMLLTGTMAGAANATSTLPTLYYNGSQAIDVQCLAGGINLFSDTSFPGSNHDGVSGRQRDNQILGLDTHTGTWAGSCTTPTAALAALKQWTWDANFDTSLLSTTAPVTYYWYTYSTTTNNEIESRTCLTPAEATANSTTLASTTSTETCSQDDTDQVRWYKDDTNKGDWHTAHNAAIADRAGPLVTWNELPNTPNYQNTFILYRPRTDGIYTPTILNIESNGTFADIAAHVKNSTASGFEKITAYSNYKFTGPSGEAHYNLQTAMDSTATPKYWYISLTNTTTEIETLSCYPNGTDADSTAQITTHECTNNGTVTTQGQRWNNGTDTPGAIYPSPGGSGTLANAVIADRAGLALTPISGTNYLYSGTTAVLLKSTSGWIEAAGHTGPSFDATAFKFTGPSGVAHYNYTTALNSEDLNAADYTVILSSSTGNTYFVFVDTGDVSDTEGNGDLLNGTNTNTTIEIVANSNPTAAQILEKVQAVYTGFSVGDVVRVIHSGLSIDEDVTVPNSNGNSTDNTPAPVTNQADWTVVPAFGGLGFNRCQGEVETCTGATNAAWGSGVTTLQARAHKAMTGFQTLSGETGDIIKWTKHGATGHVYVVYSGDATGSTEHSTYAAAKTASNNLGWETTEHTAHHSSGVVNTTITLQCATDGTNQRFKTSNDSVWHPAPSGTDCSDINTVVALFNNSTSYIGTFSASVSADPVNPADPADPADTAEWSNEYEEISREDGESIEVSATMKGKTISKEIPSTIITEGAICKRDGVKVDVSECSGQRPTRTRTTSDTAEARKELMEILMRQLVAAKRALTNDVKNDLNGLQMVGEFGEYRVYLLLSAGGVGVERDIDVSKYTQDALNKFREFVKDKLDKDVGDIASDVIFTPRGDIYGLGKDYKGIAYGAKLTVGLKAIRDGLRAGIDFGHHFSASGDKDGFSGIAVKGKAREAGLIAQYTHNRQVLGGDLTVNAGTSGVIGVDFTKQVENRNLKLAADSNGTLSAGVTISFSDFEDIKNGFKTFKLPSMDKLKERFKR